MKIVTRVTLILFSISIVLAGSIAFILIGETVPHKKICSLRRWRELSYTRFYKGGRGTSEERRNPLVSVFRGQISDVILYFELTTPAVENVSSGREAFFSMTVLFRLTVLTINQYWIIGGHIVR